ncbi:ABC transporter ATP-binding protein [Tomitella biformata]|uniref:ABC transporter ATP-binding protein n=1 Tax=Tomitella biformata TaxID=630403 RepID=UPI000A059494|nr:ABC transporter ATP-binding protein [Tomitella biformata]
MLHRGLLFGALGMSALATIIDVSFPLLTRAAIDGASAGRTSAIAAIAIAIAGLGLVRWACQFGRRLLAGKLSLDVQHRLRLDLLTSLQALDGQGQDSIRTGQVVSRSISDLQMVQGLLAMLPMVAGAALQLVLSLVVMAYLSPLLTVVTLVIAPAVAYTAYLSRRSLFAATWSAQQSAADIAQHVEETVTGVRVVKGFGQESRAIATLESLSRTLYARRIRAAHVNARYAPILASLPQLGLVCIIGLGGYLALRSSISVGTFLAFASYVTMIAAVARIVSSIIVMAQLSRAAVERVYDVIDAQPTIADSADPHRLPEGPVGVSLRGVTFGFDPARPVLHEVNLDVRPGETLALVGPAGSGKTALSLLLPRFYAPAAGSIALTAGGTTIDIVNLAREQLREVTALVFDEPFLFSDTLGANIALGAPDATAEQIRAAAIAADADEFITRLPDGYDTVVGERGLSLSGGQRQRVALARAILGDPRLLILDDATSAVDAETEARIFRALQAGRADRTTIAVAHRRSTLLLADRIAVLDGGRVVDVGTEAELEARCGLFRELLSPQPRDKVVESCDPASDRPSQERLWPEVAAPERGPARAESSAAPGSPVRGGPGAGALGSMPATPQIEAAVAALGPATEEPGLDERELRRPDPSFRLAGLLAPVRWLLATVVALVALDAVAGLVFPIIIRYAIDHGVLPRHSPALFAAVAVGVLVVFANWLVLAWMAVLTARAGERVLYGLRVRSYSHLQRLGLDYYERELSGRIMTRMTTDVDALSSFLQTGLSTAIVSFLTIVGVSGALLLTNTTLGLVALAALPPVLLATLIFRRVSSAAYSLSRERVSAVNADFQENIAGLRTSQAYRREPHAAMRFAQRADSYRRARLRAQVAISIYFPLITLLSDLVLAAVILVGAHQVAVGATSTGTLVAFVLYLGLLFGPIQQLSQVFDGYQQARVGLQRIGDLLRTKSTIETADAAAGAPVPFSGRLRGELELRGVDFQYPGAAAPALHKIDLRIPAGSTVALVGRTGAGKSTIVKLLARFYDPTAGSVLVDGVDLRRYPLADYRHRLGVVPQEAHLFTGTVAENIAFGRPAATRAQIEAAAAAVGALDTIAAMPAGMLEPVGERGQGLSSGQRQLIALARAELVDPDVLLLDEATASLDPVTELTVLESNRQIMRRRTSVLVAHRLATAEQADIIVVVEDGQIIEAGPTAELQAAGGAYARLRALAVVSHPVTSNSLI